MKTFKKICLGVGLAALFAVVFQVFPASKALAAGGPINGESEWRQATYTMNQKSTIIVNLAGNDHDNINFNSTSKAGVYKADTNNTGVCDGQITFNSGQTLSSHPIKATINVDYMNSASGMPTCTAGAHNGANDSYSGSISITNNTTDGGQQGADTGPKTISYQGDTYTQLNTTSYKTVYGTSTDINSCYGGSLIILAKVDSKANAPVTGTLISISGPVIGGGELISKHVPYWPVSGNPSVPGLGSCTYRASSDSQNELLSVAANGTATFKCSTTDAKTCVANTQKKDPAAGDTTASCESNFDSGFEWVLCPMFKLADSAAGAFNSFIEGQLCFKTTNESTSSTGSSVVCSGSNNLDSGVHNAWNIFKNLASALIVIALLIMVISQAIGGGPFDAYTIRKMLPKLVAAVIIMQISWFLLKWAIDLSNDAGAAIGNLIMAPFGGESNLNLDHLMGNAFAIHTTGTNNTFAFFTVLAAGTAAFIVSIPTLGLMALYVVMALLTAFIVLIFRKLLIILLVILAPIAFVAWVMPGMDKYWTMWRTQFTKLLLMF
ncbi:MAG TPA: hypothetical protein VFJ84_03300, partial [Candidatus Saccharimonadales bacterium]|nr:hypothetical protein [Candidatus Saccharimonadales bacterium]